MLSSAGTALPCSRPSQGPGAARHAAAAGFAGAHPSKPHLKADTGCTGLNDGISISRNMPGT